MATILLIDDDSTFRTIVRETLSSEGYSILETTDAGSGITVAMAQQPDLIISDFLMPGIPGKSVFEELSNNPKTRHIPIIVMSGLPKEKIQGYIPKHLWSNILSKPPDFDTLPGFIEGVLKQKKSVKGWLLSVLPSWIPFPR